MDQTSYPRRPSSYQPFLSLMWGNHGTAADAVAERFDWAPLEALDARYLAAAGELARRKERAHQLREKHSFEGEDGKRHICPLLLRDLLSVLPEDEPLPPRGARKLLAKCRCTTACYACIRSYKNRFFHGQLDRHLGLYLLDYLLTGELPEWDGAQRRRVVRSVAADVAFQARADEQEVEEVVPPAAVDGAQVSVGSALRIRGGDAEVELLLGLARPLYDRSAGHRFADPGLQEVDGTCSPDLPGALWAPPGSLSSTPTPSASRRKPCRSSTTLVTSFPPPSCPSSTRSTMPASR